MRVLILLAIVATASMLGSSVTGASVGEIITESLFNEMLKHRNDPVCPAKNFYTYGAFIEAANSFPGFGTTGDLPTRQRELAAFFGQTSQETTGRGPTQPYEWGYCFKEEADPNNRYHGRGPIQLTGDYNYRPAGEAIRVDLINNPDLITSDPVIAFKSAIWFWMTPQQPKPSIHDVMTGKWVPSAADTAARRFPGYGVVTNIINGGIECGKGNNLADNNRQEYYKRYCGMLGVQPGTNLGCGDQKPFNIQ